MPRPSRCRRVCAEPCYRSFSPNGSEGTPCVHLTVDEYEAIRLVDYEKQTHEGSAALMGVSRTTVTEIYERARYKLADCIINGKTLRIGGGNYHLCGGTTKLCCGRPCPRAGELTRGGNTMKIAVTYEDGQIFQHFGHTEQFKVYTVENGAVTKSEVVDTNGSGHGALAGFLNDYQVDTLICGGIGGGAQMALTQAGIKLYGGVTGDADAAVQALLNGKLDYDPDVHCDHHDHGEGHDCGSHGCGHSC